VKKGIAIILLIPVLVLLGTREASTRGSFSLENVITVESKP